MKTVKQKIKEIKAMLSSKKREKIKQLFLSIQKEKSNGNKCLSKAIENAGSLLNIKKESAKNYYYKNLKFLKQNPQIAKSMGIDLSAFEQKKFEKFNSKSKEELYKIIVGNLTKGKSVRQTCMELAHNDAKQMLRFQNKFRNMQKQKESQIKQDKEIEQKKVINISSAKHIMNKKISDDEINALFLGLIKIVKKAAIENANEELKNECKEATENFKQTIIDLNKKEAELKKVYEINSELNLKIESQQQQICLLLEKLSNRKINELEKKSGEKYLRLKSFGKTTKNDNIL